MNAVDGPLHDVDGHRVRLTAPEALTNVRTVLCCPALKMTMTPSLSMKTKMVALVATLTG